MGTKRKPAWNRRVNRMEHNDRQHALALIARFARRRWKVPLALTGGALTVATLMGAAALGPHQPRMGQQVHVARAAITAGVVESLYARIVGSSFPAPVQKLYVHEGQTVRKG